MSRWSHILFFSSRSETRVPLWLADAAIALIGVVCITGIVALFQLSFIRNISLLYLFVVWGLAVRRGLYAAVCASVLAFFAFDFFLVTPLYQFTISDPSEWVALFFFLATAIVTGIFASILRESIEDSRQREREARNLYELVKATASEENEQRQLAIVANTIREVFASAGVRECHILLATDLGQQLRWESIPAAKLPPSEEELTARASVLRRGKREDVHDVPLTVDSSHGYIARAIIQHSTGRHTTQHYVRFVPLKVAQRVVGIVRLTIEDDSTLPADEQLLTTRSHSPSRGPSRFEQAVSNVLGMNVRHEPALLRPSFFEAFLDQIVLIIESARLRRESLQVEVLQRTDALRAALLSSVSHDLRTPLASIKAKRIGEVSR